MHLQKDTKDGILFSPFLDSQVLCVRNVIIKQNN